jgi:hypothetical protein
VTGLQTFVRAVGWTSLGLAAVAAVRPRALAAAAGVQTPDDPALPLLVRLCGARQAVVGLALLTRSPVDVGRSAGLFLPLTAADLVAVVAAHREGVVARRSVVMATVVLTTNVLIGRER